MEILPPAKIRAMRYHSSNTCRAPSLRHYSKHRILRLLELISIDEEASHLRKVPGDRFHAFNYGFLLKNDE